MCFIIALKFSIDITLHYFLDQGEFFLLSCPLDVLADSSLRLLMICVDISGFSWPPLMVKSQSLHLKALYNTT